MDAVKRLTEKALRVRCRLRVQGLWVAFKLGASSGGFRFGRTPCLDFATWVILLKSCFNTYLEPDFF